MIIYSISYDNLLIITVNKAPLSIDFTQNRGLFPQRLLIPLECDVIILYALACSQYLIPSSCLHDSYIAEGTSHLAASVAPHTAPSTVVRFFTFSPVEPLSFSGDYDNVFMTNIIMSLLGYIEFKTPETA